MTDIEKMCHQSVDTGKVLITPFNITAAAPPATRTATETIMLIRNVCGNNRKKASASTSVNPIVTEKV